VDDTSGPESWGAGLSGGVKFALGADDQAGFGQSGSNGLIDVFISAGEVTGHGPEGDDEGYLACNEKHTGNCNWYRVRLNLGCHHAVNMWRHWRAEKDHSAPIQSTISPDGTWGAIVEREQLAGKAEGKSRLRYGEFGTHGWDSLACDGGWKGSGWSEPSKDRPQFPNWYADDVLLFTTKDEEDGTLWGFFYPDSAKNTVGLLGRRGLARTDGSFKDPNTHDDTNRIVTWSGDGSAATPLVHDIWGGHEEEFELGDKSNGDELKACHHPAWGPDGDRVLCTSMGGTESGEPAWRWLYQFAWDGSRWSNDGRVFVPPGEVDMNAYADGVFPEYAEGDDETCQVYVYKFAEWCLSNDYVIATLYCSNSHYNDTFPILMSRVVLIHFTEDASPAGRIVDDIWDLTAVVEYDEGVGRGSYHGVFGTCSATSKDAWP
jgi:hypothetical protein